MTHLRQRAEALVKELTVEPTKGSFQADADEWAAKCKTTDELIEMIYQLALAVQQEERAACANISPNGLDINASDAPHIVWNKYRAAIRQRGGGGMNRHNITLDEVVNNMTIRYLIAASHGKNTSKELYLHATFSERGAHFIEYEVRNKRESVFVSAMLGVAIEKYNELP